MTGNRHFRRHQHGTQTFPGFGCGNGGRQDASLTGWNASEKDTRVVSCHSWNSRIVTRYRSGTSGTWSTIETLVTRTQFLATRHQYSCEQTRCQIVQVIAPRIGVGRSVFGGSKFSGQGFDLLIGAIRHHFPSYLEAEPEVQSEIALHQSTRSPKGTLVE